MDEKDRFLGRELQKISNCIKRATRANCRTEVDDEDITAINRWLIMYLYDHRDEDVFQKDIEFEFSVRRSTCSSIISLMEKKGFIERVSVEHDARLKKIVLTLKALEKCDVIHRETVKFEKILESGISPQELEIFYSVLDKITDNINNI